MNKFTCALNLHCFNRLNNLDPIRWGPLIRRVTLSYLHLNWSGLYFHKWNEEWLLMVDMMNDFDGWTWRMLIKYTWGDLTDFITSLWYYYTWYRGNRERTELTQVVSWVILYVTPNYIIILLFVVWNRQRYLVVRIPVTVLLANLLGTFSCKGFFLSTTNVNFLV